MKKFTINSTVGILIAVAALLSTAIAANGQFEYEYDLTDSDSDYAYEIVCEEGDSTFDTVMYYDSNTVMYYGSPEYYETFGDNDSVERVEIADPVNQSCEDLMLETYSDDDLLVLASYGISCAYEQLAANASMRGDIISCLDYLEKGVELGNYNCMAVYAILIINIMGDEISKEEAEYAEELLIKAALAGVPEAIEFINDLNK